MVKSSFLISRATPSGWISGSQEMEVLVRGLFIFPAVTFTMWLAKLGSQVIDAVSMLMVGLIMPVSKVLFSLFGLLEAPVARRNEPLKSPLVIEAPKRAR